ncbi:6-phosphogluconolactonase [Zhongshania marina]|uniref:6-phosphogluconolactonase n=1 Tax=Zhongshania marina TaxID=2304603 RepID=A0A2S4HCV3_9GAMM|nr:6-phosphogluconolactonase [Marortus luteolus]POP51832.1 6-phosphogluconolactonase [Marortus luteolus]
MNNKPTLILLPNRDELDQVLSRDIANILATSLHNHGSASLAVSGGSTPENMLSLLGQAPLDWPLVQTLLVDERWVANDHASSNEAMLRKTLLKSAASSSKYLPLKNNADSAENGQYLLEAELDALTWPLSLVHLGMGEDGHTASWFHDAPEYQALRTAHAQHCFAVQPGSAPYPRITLSPNAVFNSEKIVIHITGRAKREVLEKALSQDADYPISMVLHQQQVPVDIYWAP